MLHVCMTLILLTPPHDRTVHSKDDTIFIDLFLRLDSWPLDPLDPPKSFKGFLFLKSFEKNKKNQEKQKKVYIQMRHSFLRR